MQHAARTHEKTQGLFFFTDKHWLDIMEAVGWLKYGGAFPIKILDHFRCCNQRQEELSR